MGTRTPARTDETKEVACSGCGQPYRSDCDWRQGRCPQHPPLLPSIVNFFKHLFKTKQ